jgi:hypothetical protein
MPGVDDWLLHAAVLPAALMDNPYAIVGGMADQLGSDCQVDIDPY